MATGYAEKYEYVSLGELPLFAKTLVFPDFVNLIGTDLL